MSINIDDINEIIACIKKMESNIDLLCRALEIAGSYARNYLPAELPNEDFKSYLPIIVGGTDRDPQGKEFTTFWLKCASEELLKEKKI